jgi:Ca2+/Na+ antiporter
VITKWNWGCRDSSPMIVGFTTICAISAYHHSGCELEPCSWWGALDTTLCDKICQWLATGRWFSPVSFTNKSEHHNITEILLKVAFFFYYTSKIKIRVRLMPEHTTITLMSCQVYSYMSLKSNKMKNKNSHTVLTVPKSNSKIVERGEINSPNTLIHDSHFPGLVQTLQWNMSGLNQFKWTQFIYIWKGSFNNDDHKPSNINNTNNHISPQSWSVNTKKKRPKHLVWETHKNVVGLNWLMRCQLFSSHDPYDYLLSISIVHFYMLFCIFLIYLRRDIFDIDTFICYIYIEMKSVMWCLACFQWV